MSGDPNLRALAGALSPAQTYLRTEGLGPDANNQLTQVKSDAVLLSGQMNNPQSPVRQALSLLESGQLRNDVIAARTAANELSSGADQLSSGLVELSDGADQLASGTTQLAAGTQQLAGKVNDGVKEIPKWSEKQKEEFANALSQPVALHENTLNEAKTFGTGFTPFFFGLALFVGSII
ncbi:hypothetical protein GOOTI_038_00060, partial [Gordonia otitidis NBRC 100426]